MESMLYLENRNTAKTRGVEQVRIVCSEASLVRVVSRARSWRSSADQGNHASGKACGGVSWDCTRHQSKRFVSTMYLQYYFFTILLFTILLVLAFDNIYE